MKALQENRFDLILLLLKIVIVLLPLILLSACKGKNCSESQPSEPLASGSSDLPLQDYEILFLGNSHSSANNLPGLVTQLLNVGQPNKSARAQLAPGWKFLDERLADRETQPVLVGRAWTHVILQAQKYSSTGLYSYPTTAAEEWIRRIKHQDAIPVMFPEWPRRGNFEEGQRVHQLHLSIAAREATCVAPIGLAWDESIIQYPELSLHAADGNHSNLTGALLTAYILYGIISHQPIDSLPYVASIAVSESVQLQLKTIASVILFNNLPCEFYD